MYKCYFLKKKNMYIIYGNPKTITIHVNTSFFPPPKTVIFDLLEQNIHSFFFPR